MYPRTLAPGHRSLDPETLVEKGSPIDLDDPIIIRQGGRIIEDLLSIVR